MANGIKCINVNSTQQSIDTVVCLNNHDIVLIKL